MVTLIKYGTLSGGEKYNINILNIDGLSTDTKPTVVFVEYGSDGREIGRVAIPNGSKYNEIDTGKKFRYDAENAVWYETSSGGSGGTQDAEVQNARVDASGTSFTTLKERLDAHDYLQQNTQNELKHQFEITDDKYARISDGKIRDSANLFVTNYIPLDYPVVVRSKLDDDAAGICFYNASKSFISGYNSYSSNEQEVILTPPTNAAFVRVSCLKTYKKNFVCRYDNVLTTLTKNVSDINNDIENIQTVLNTILQTLNDE